MATYFHRDVHSVEVAAIDGADPVAVEVLGLWGWRREVVRVPVAPCQREYCRGSILRGSCLLCARDPGGVQGTEPGWAAMLGQAEPERLPRQRWGRGPSGRR
jgi:hypothetical protein